MQHGHSGLAVAEAISQMNSAADVGGQQQIGSLRFDLVEFFGTKPIGDFGMFDCVRTRCAAAARLLGHIEHGQRGNAREQ